MLHCPPGEQQVLLFGGSRLLAGYHLGRIPEQLDIRLLDRESPGTRL